MSEDDCRVWQLGCKCILSSIHDRKVKISYFEVAFDLCLSNYFLMTLYFQGAVHVVAFSPDGKHLVSSGNLS